MDEQDYNPYELKTPLTAIRGFLQLVQLTELNTEQKDNLDEMDHAAEHLSNLVNKIIDTRKDVEERKIVRSIEFSPEHYQAGLSILTYFSEIIKNKYPDEEVKIGINQEGLRVTLIIETPEGKREVIEKTLEDYGSVVCGNQPVSSLLPKELDALELKQQLSIAKIQLEHKKEMLNIERSHSEQMAGRLNTIESQYSSLTLAILNGIDRRDRLNERISEFASSLVGMQSQVLTNSLSILQSKTEAGITESDEQEIKAALREIAKNDGKVLRKLEDIALGAISGASGQFLYTWIMEIIKILPKF